MINSKVKLFYGDFTSRLQDEMNEFLETIDVRQILKTEYSTAASSSSYRYTAVIYYVDLADVRNVKLDNVLEIK